MTNEAILKQQKIVKYIPYFIKAMDAAREDEAIRFAEWVKKVFVIKKGRYIFKGDFYNQDKRNFTTEQLYQLYKKQNP